MRRHGTETLRDLSTSRVVARSCPAADGAGPDHRGGRRPADRADPAGDLRGGRAVPWPGAAVAGPDLAGHAGPGAGDDLAPDPRGQYVGAAAGPRIRALDGAPAGQPAGAQP